MRRQCLLIIFCEKVFTMLDKIQHENNLCDSNLNGVCATNSQRRHTMAATEVTLAHYNSLQTTFYSRFSERFEMKSPKEKGSTLTNRPLPPQPTYLASLTFLLQIMRMDGQVGGYPIKFLEQIVRLSKSLKQKREYVNALRDLVPIYH